VWCGAAVRGVVWTRVTCEMLRPNSDYAAAVCFKNLQYFTVCSTFNWS
jgi:hypothetical protein